MDWVALLFGDRLIRVPIRSLRSELKEYLGIGDLSLLERNPNMVVIVDLLRAGFYKHHSWVVPKEFFIYGTQDLKGVLNHFVSCLKGNVRTTWRDTKRMHLEVVNFEQPGYELGITERSLFWISFLRYPSINDTLKEYDWVLPKAMYDHTYVYYRPYASYALYQTSNKDVYQSVYVRSLTPDIRQVGIGPNEVGCSWCPMNINKHDSYDVKYHKRLMKVANGASYKLVIREQNAWDATSITSYYDEVLNCRIGVGDSERERELSKRPLFKALLEVQLPFEFKEPKPFHKGLCTDCLALYKPVWSFDNLKWYKSEVVWLYLVLQKHGLVLDVVILIQGLIELLKVKDKIEAHLLAL